MTEHLLPEHEKQAREQRKRDFIALAGEIIEAGERFPFPGINPGAYAKLQAVEAEYPGCATAVDELVKKFNAQGMRVAFGDHPLSGNVFILPASDETNWGDSLFPRHLEITAGMDEKLKRLITMSREANF